MIRAVLGTNVLASGGVGITRQESTPGELLRRWRAKAFTLVVSEPILTELGRTLANPYFRSRLSPTAIGAALGHLRNEARIQPITLPVSGVATHPQDDLILATALSAQANYLVTGDKRLLDRGIYQGPRLLSPREFFEVLESGAHG